MAKVKALTSFAGLISMPKGKVGEITDEVILSDLIRAGYVEVLKEKTPAKKKGDK